IPFAVPGAVMARCTATAPLLSVAALRPARAGLVLTRFETSDEGVLSRAASNQHTRLARLGSAVARELRCPHDEEPLAAALAELLAEGCSPLLVLGAAAVVDRGDVVPQAIVRAGGVIDHLGMPADPGNLLLCGHIGATPVLGVPGCARTLKPSGFDWALE